MTSRARLALLAAFGAVYFIWGSTFLAIAIAVETIPPFLMIGMRCVVAGGVLYGWARARGGRRPLVADWRAAAVAGILLFVTGQAVLAWAETRIPSGAASLLIATEPLFIALLAWRGGRWSGSPGRRPAGGTLFAIVLGFTGVGLLVLPGAGGHGLDLAGAAAAVAASLSWSVGVFRAGARPGIGAGQMAGMQLLVAGALLVAGSAVAGELSSFAAAAPSGRSLAAFAYLVVLGSIVAFGAYVWLLERVGPTRLSTHAYVNPVVAVVLGVLANGEAVSAGLLLATTLILGSVALLLRAGRAAGPPEALPPHRAAPGVNGAERRLRLRISRRAPVPAAPVPRPARPPRFPAATGSSATARPRRTP